MYGMPQGAREGGAAMSGCTVCRKEPSRNTKALSSHCRSAFVKRDGVYMQAIAEHLFANMSSHAKKPLHR